MSALNADIVKELRQQADLELTVELILNANINELDYEALENFAKECRKSASTVMAGRFDLGDTDTRVQARDLLARAIIAETTVKAIKNQEAFRNKLL
jgi:hypothetical protein